MLSLACRLQIFNLVVSVLASIYIQRFSRRFIWLFSTCGILLCYSMFTLATARFNSTGDVHAGRAAVALIFLCVVLHPFARASLARARS